ncbi:MAG: response regulator [Candidatus Margulisiibacteriota bacterium]
MRTVLIIDDEKDIVENIEYNLTKEGYKISRSYDGINGLEAVQKKMPDIVILDLMLPGMTGIEVCKAMRSDPKTASIPIIMLTARGEETDKIVGLEVGADDYMTKPFSIRELAARIKAILKRYGKKAEPVVSSLIFSGLDIDPDSHTVKVSGKEIALTAKEFLLLEHLARNPERVFSRDRLLDLVWGIDVAIETRTVDVHVRRLREKLGKSAKYLKTIHGVGYKFSVK